MDIIEKLKAKYKLSSETETFLKMKLDQLANGGGVDGVESPSKDDGAETNDKLAADFDGQVKEFAVPSAGVPNGIPIDVIKPNNCARRPGILINFHGGGNVCGSRKTTETVCKLLAKELKCVVVNVEYRLAPEHKFPAMFDDGKAVVRWVLMNKSLVGGENDSKVGVIGSSSGGGIAATIAFEVPGGVEMCIRTEADKTNVRASPLLRKDFTVLPPTLLLIAEIDPYKDSNYEFKSKMKAANAVCESKLMKGAIHGFFSLPGQFQETNQRAREIIAQFYKKYGVC
ncbi:hypothetical protein Btru_018717 [Bulinus truncatus]|nr:hypothetical protein Btru_018717 [Bulinus truncatus]